MGSGKFGFNTKKDKVTDNGAAKTEFSVKEKYQKIQKKLKKTEKKKTEDPQEKTIWWNQCNSRKFLNYRQVINWLLVYDVVRILMKVDKL